MTNGQSGAPPANEVYPKEYKFPNCPNCGADSRIANNELEILKSKGQVRPNMITFVAQHQVVVTDPNKQMLTAPVIVAHLDICSECGTVYSPFAVVNKVTPSLKAGSKLFDPTQFRNRG